MISELQTFSLIIQKNDGLTVYEELERMAGAVEDFLLLCVGHKRMMIGDSCSMVEMNDEDWLGRKCVCVCGCVRSICKLGVRETCRVNL